MSDFSRPTPEEISAYLDGELDAERRAAVSYYLSTNAEAAREVVRQQALDDGLRALGRRDALTDIPPSVVAALGSLREEVPRSATAQKSIRRSHFLAAASVAAIFLVGIFLYPILGRDIPADSDITADVLYFLDLGAARAEFGPEERDTIARTLVGFDAALSDTPRLRQAGFTLTGGRLIAKRGQGAILLFYDSLDGSPVGLLISSASIEPAPRNLNTVYWRKDMLSFAAVGRVTIARLQTFQMAFENN